MYKILITDKLAQEGIDLINAMDDFEPVVRTGISEDELAEIIGEYDGLIIRSATTVTPKVLENSGWVWIILISRPRHKRVYW
jgi:D-3-phosphoglycerate dehydrogenase